MKKLQSSLINMTVVLTVISVIAAGVLAYINKITQEPIAEINEKTLQEGIKLVILGTTEGKLTVAPPLEKGSYTIYTTDKGTAVKAAENAFGGPLEILVGFDESGAIQGYTILKTVETPGLGVKASTWFQKGEKGDIIGRKLSEKELAVKQDGGEIDAITASTITSRAFLTAVNAAYRAYKDKHTDSMDQQTGATPKAQTDVAAQKPQTDSIN